MPATDLAVGDGRITGSHAHLLARCRNQRTAEVFAEQEVAPVGVAETMSADELAHFVEAWLPMFDPDGPDPGGGRDDVFHLSQTLEGRLKGTFDLGGELAIRAKAVFDETTDQLRREDRAARDVDPTDPRAGETTSRRRARALGRILDRAAVSPISPARREPLFTVHTNLATLAGSPGPDEWKAALEVQWRSASAGATRRRPLPVNVAPGACRRAAGARRRACGKGPHPASQISAVNALGPAWQLRSSARPGEPRGSPSRGAGRSRWVQPNGRG